MRCNVDLTGPITRSRLTMGQLIWRKYRDVQVTFAFRNRTVRARIGEVIAIGELRDQLDHAHSLMHSNSELHYLRGTNEYQQRMFDEDYLEFLRALRLPDYRVERRGDERLLEFAGAWGEITYWQTIALSIVNAFNISSSPISPVTSISRSHRISPRGFFCRGRRPSGFGASCRRGRSAR